MNHRQFVFASASVALLALLVRESFVLTAICPFPTQGDAGEYLRYAAHLADGYFGRGDVPDAYRAPGYPVLLWLTRAWIIQAQVVLGVATVGGVMSLARLWMPRGFALAAGICMALQPHNIVASGTLLSEVLYGTLVVGALLATAYAYQRRSTHLAVIAGALFGAAYLTNPVIALLPFLLAPLFFRAGLARSGTALGLVALLAMGSWGVRNALSDAQGDARARMNFVQGSWPEYHRAWKWQNFQGHDTYAAINAEVASGSLRPSLDRMAAKPAYYAAWYASKVFLLWDWSVRIGQGGVYTVQFDHSPLERGWLGRTAEWQRALNPLLFALAVCGLILGIRGGPQAMVALAVLYVTSVHVLLQAEPRYAIPYRSLEIVLAWGTIAFLVERLLQHPAEDPGNEDHVPVLRADACVEADAEQILAGRSSPSLPPG